MHHKPTDHVKGKIMENLYFLVGLVVVFVVLVIALALKGGVTIGSLTLTLGKLVIKDISIMNRKDVDGK